MVQRKRMKLIAVCLLMAMMVLAGRLMQIQLFQTEHFSKHRVNLLKESVKQRTHEIILDDGRGQFLDRDGKPLSYEEKQVLVLFPFIRHLDWKNDRLGQILNVPAKELEKAVHHAEKPFVFGGKEPFILDDSQAAAINALKIPGAYAVAKKYEPSTGIAGQLIGIASENERVFNERYPKKVNSQSMKIGVTGLQESFDEFLLPESEAKLIYHVDGIGAPLFGIDVKYTGQGNSFYPLEVQTTIDRRLQAGMEEILDKNGVSRGGAILLNIETNDILAVASRPRIKPGDPFSNEGTKNLMFDQHVPGSVFKTAVAAAAMEKGLVDEGEAFNCSLDIRGEAAERNLGMLNLRSSFSQSCNRIFGELAARLMKADPQLLDDYARKLGLTGAASWEGTVFHVKGFKQFAHDKGKVFADDESRKDANFVVQTGIGQHEVRVTPVGVANMMAAIARGGEKKKIRAATAIQYGNGSPMYSFPVLNDSEESISKYTAIRMQQLLRSVVTDEKGTGSLFRELPYQVAGKSGTAETGILRDGRQLYHKWFAGYFPFENPKFSLVVVNMDVHEDQGAVNPIYAEMVSMIFHESETDGENGY
ncbi:MAG TPA: penicillin-binding transpeptidase domain-containing protein [Bacillaceae bacterium]